MVLLSVEACLLEGIGGRVPTLVSDSVGQVFGRWMAWYYEHQFKQLGAISLALLCQWRRSPAILIAWMLVGISCPAVAWLFLVRSVDF